MTSDEEHAAALHRLAAAGGRYPVHAYALVYAVLDAAHNLAGSGEAPSARRHFRGQELLEALRCYALDSFGPMAKTVLNEWNIHRGEDFGAVVFALIEAGLLAASEDDSIGDFADGYDFETAFQEPFAETRPIPGDLPPLD